MPFSILIVVRPHNTIAIGGLIAKETTGPVGGDTYIYGGTGAQFNQDNGYNSLIFGGGQQRTVYVGYISDKIDLFNDKLHIEPAFRVTSAYTSNIVQQEYSYNPGKYKTSRRLASHISAFPTIYLSI
ncbi:MAG: hypothetical protein KGQ79_06705 [Proteobacteria bacterium]|nr:hypothetical protein [Pseudomonadota bacterium]